jgi:hypothetical protein
MNANSPQQPEELTSTVRALHEVVAHEVVAHEVITPGGPAGPPAGFPHGRPEAGFLSGPGKSVYRRVIDLLSRRNGAAARTARYRAAAGRARQAADERKHGHRGGNRTWLLRSLILLGIAAEAVTAYVAMEVLVASQSLAVGLSALTAAVGAGMACILANRRLNGLGVPITIRILEGIFVTVLTVLRYESLSVQGAGYLAAAGAAGLAALISALGLLGIEEIVVETHTFAVFVGALRASWLNWRWTSATADLAATEAAAEAAADKLQRHYLEYLLRSEAMPLAEARGHAAALRAAVTSTESMS